jgi:hypothetical protein
MTPVRPKVRNVRIGGAVVARTPLLLPSYSSRALNPDVRRQGVTRRSAERTLKLLVGPVLISAYDLDAGAFRDDGPDGGSLIGSRLTFIDSGGYENLVDPDPDWTRERHAEALGRWPGETPAIMVGYDTPASDVAEQIASAASILPGRSVGRELLLKPVPDAGRDDRGGILDVIEQLGRNGPALEGVDVLGITEKEAGSTLSERVRTVLKLRRVLDGLGSDLPVHLFGGLDPALTPLFFLAGADVFDGLSWLRYAFVDGEALYMQPAAAWRHPDLDLEEASWRVRARNFSELTRMQTAMQRYVRAGDPGSLHPRGAELLASLADWAADEI